MSPSAKAAPPAPLFTLTWSALVRTPEGALKALSGSRRAGAGPLHLAADLPAGQIVKISAELPLITADHEKIFMNGYQTWTYCPEYTRKSGIRSLHFTPGFGVKKFRLDRYGDYHFIKDPIRPGKTHGFSYCYFRLGGHFRLFASLNEAPGYTVFRYDAGKNLLTLERDAEGLRTEGGPYPLFDLYIDAGSEEAVFDGWFAQLGLPARAAAPLAGYSSWYNRYENISEADIRQDLSGAARVLEKGDLFQIDDGWEPAVGDWLVPDPVKFPNGLRPLVDDIHEKGFLAGLWLAPFVCQLTSEVYRTHPDWLLLHDGEPWEAGSNWGGFAALDIDNPEVIAYMRETFRRVFDEWGFDLVKLDFLYAAAPYGTEHETRAGRMIRAMRFLREAAGEKLILGCGVPVMPAFGLVDYCRVSCDVGLDWDDTLIMKIIHRERVSTHNAIFNSIFRRQLNGRAYGLDPDVFFLREDNLKLTPPQKSALARVCALFGSVFLTSDDMSSYSEEQIRLYRRLRRLREAADVCVSADDARTVTVSYRLDGQPASFTLPLSRHDSRKGKDGPFPL